jgi:hypothetical protein
MSNHAATSTDIWNSGWMLDAWSLNTEADKQLTQHINSIKKKLKIYTSLTVIIQESYSPIRIQHGNEKIMKNDKEVFLYLNILI